MSDAHNEHESVIKTPKQLIAAIAASFLIPIICIVLLVQYVANNRTTGAGSNSDNPEAVEARLKPVAAEGFTLIDSNAPKQLQAGVAVYKAVCAACHDTGAAGAPKTGDAAAWSARIARGYDAVVTNAINGIRAMPPKGGNPDLDDVEVARAMVYMANLSGAKFKEPEVKVPAAPAAGAKDAGANVEPPTAGAPVASATKPITTPSAQVKELAPDTGKVSADAGKKLYEAACQACHTPGIAGAPKLGDKAAWADRIKQGNNVLYEHAIKGFQGKTGVMPPKGGSTASDAEVKAAVDLMTAASR
jgi:cytochrome c5